MHLKFQNVDDAFFGLVSKIHSGEIPTVTRASRAGEVLTVEEPMLITYDRPRERVLFNEARDCNPFFHLFESLWMLAGRNDVAPLAKYNSKIAEIASDDGKTFNGAYGYRWRGCRVYDEEMSGPYNEFKYVDQLKIIIDHLKNKPESRRAVLQMWNVEDDLLKIGSDNPSYKFDGSAKYFKDGLPTFPPESSGREGSKDVCCNTHVYFLVELGDCYLCKGSPYAGEICPNCKGKPHDVPRYLNMTVCNRSNDLIWGLLGANVVHFSFLQEYMAACIGLEVGTYNQMTNNLHVYTNNWEPEKWLKHYHDRTMHDLPVITYEEHVKETVPLVKDPETFDQECAEFIDVDYRSWSEPFLRDVAYPMCRAFKSHKRREYKEALKVVSQVRSDDWRIAATNWIRKRQEVWEKKNGVQTSSK